MAKSKGDSGEKSVSQVDMVKKALEELGADAKPLAIQESIKANFGKDLPTTIISNYKSVLKRKGGGAAVSVAAGRGRPTRGSGSIHLDDLEAVRGLVSKLGADQVRRLVDVLAH